MYLSRRQQETVLDLIEEEMQRLESSCINEHLANVQKGELSRIHKTIKQYMFYDDRLREMFEEDKHE